MKKPIHTSLSKTKYQGMHKLPTTNWTLNLAAIVSLQQTTCFIKLSKFTTPTRAPHISFETIMSYLMELYGILLPKYILNNLSGTFLCIGSNALYKSTRIHLAHNGSNIKQYLFLHFFDKSLLYKLFTYELITHFLPLRECLK